MSVHKDEKYNIWYFRKRILNIDGTTSHVNIRGFKTKKEAQIAEANFSPIKKGSNLSFNELCDKYLTYLQNKLKPSTIYGKKLMIKNYMRSYFEHSNIKNIPNQYVLNWIEMLKRKDLKIIRINKILAELNCVLEYGEKFHEINHNPCRVIGYLRDNTPRDKQMLIWTPREFNQFIEKCEDINYFTLFNVLYYTGIRLGEALALTWNDINRIAKSLSICKTMCQKASGETQFQVTSPKTNSGNRIIDLPTRLFEILMNYESHIKTSHTKTNPSDLIFGINKPFSETSICRYKNKICKEANVKQIRIHDLRHSHASLLISMGINPLFIKERLGHKEVSTTLNVYSHLFPTNQKEIVNRLDNVISNNWF